MRYFSEDPGWKRIPRFQFSNDKGAAVEIQFYAVSLLGDQQIISTIANDVRREQLRREYVKEHAST